MREKHGDKTDKNGDFTNRLQNPAEQRRLQTLWSQMKEAKAQEVNGGFPHKALGGGETLSTWRQDKVQK